MAPKSRRDFQRVDPILPAERDAGLTGVPDRRPPPELVQEARLVFSSVARCHGPQDRRNGRLRHGTEPTEQVECPEANRQVARLEPIGQDLGGRFRIRAEPGEPDGGFKNIRRLCALKPLHEDGDRLPPDFAVELGKLLDEQEAEARLLVPQRRQEKRRHARSRSA